MAKINKAGSTRAVSGARPNMKRELEKPRKWQDVISKWDAWAKSIEAARKEIEKQYGELNKLVAKADYKWHHQEKDSEFAFEIELNPEGKVLWEVHRELRKRASEFVSHEMGLNPSSAIHRVFANFWIESVFPEVKQPPQLQPDLNNVEIEHVADKDGKIISTLKWDPKSISPLDAFKLFVWESLFTNYDTVLRKTKGGRPRKSRQLTIYTEAITCAILKDKQRLRHREIASLFGWTCQRDSYGNLSTSSKGLKRVNFGRKILQQHHERNH
jgi:hypothetical protein